MARPLEACAAPWLDRLDDALGLGSAEERDAALARLETCPDAPSGWVRALRAELAPAGCGDALVEDFYAHANPKPPIDVESTLLGLALGARLSRLDSGPPQPPTPNTKAAFLAYAKEELAPWLSERAAAIFELSSQGARLEGYGRGVVAVEAAIADLRFVQMARDVPLPEEMKSEPAVSNEYYAALDVTLEPRKTRGRDAALAGLAAFAELGVINSPRIDQAHAILSASYGGHRIDALNGLLLPSLPTADSGQLMTRLAQRLPTFFAQRVLEGSDPTQPAMLRALLERGLYPSARQRLDGAPMSFESSELYARGLVALGQRYWQSQNFQRAAEVAAVPPPAGQPASESAKLLAALSHALDQGPKDARDMIVGGPLLPNGVGDVAELDELAKGSGEVSAMAAFDAAYVLSFLPPTSDVKDFWVGIGQRYERAAKLTKDETLKKDAAARAKAARETAKAVKE